MGVTATQVLLYALQREAALHPGYAGELRQDSF